MENAYDFSCDTVDYNEITLNFSQVRVGDTIANSEVSFSGPLWTKQADGKLVKTDTWEISSWNDGLLIRGKADSKVKVIRASYR